MSDCGCGSSDGNCTDNLDSNAKNAQVTGNLKYDGPSKSCSIDSSIDVATNDSFNTVLQKILDKLCVVSKPQSYLAHTSRDHALTNAINVRQILNLVEFTGINNLKNNEMIRVVYTGKMSTVATTGNLDIDARVYGKDSAGIYTTPTNFLIWNVSAGNTVLDQFWINVEITKVSNTILHFNIYAKSRLDYFPFSISSNNVAMADLSSHELVIDFTALREDASDVFELSYVSMEHVRP
jgi:hypothetical protein